jgi:predicted AAA+ superfamily ATPase
MEREIIYELAQWYKKANRKPLIVRGARQVGKSYIIREFGKQFFSQSFIEINLERNPELHQIFDKNFDTKRILTEIQLISNVTIISGKSLLFIDEIQACPKAILALRYFYEEMPQLHIIAAGSLLEFALNEISFPVGRISLLNMYPMSFLEYLTSVNNEKLVDFLKQKPDTIPDIIHIKIKEHLKNYMFVGGMPECVQSFITNGNFNEVREIQHTIITTFRQDFFKYSPKVDTNCLNDLLSSLSQKTGQQIKYSSLSTNYSNPTIKKAFDLLVTARLISKIPSTSPSGIPINALKNDKFFKSVFLDIGLLGCINGMPIKTEYQKNDLLAIYKGAIAEQFVGQELIAAGLELFYWSRNSKSSTAETDYLIEYKGTIIPIEVKNSVKGRLKSLHLLFETYKNVQTAIVFNDAPLLNKKAEKITYLPLYLSCLAYEYVTPTDSYNA